MATKPLSVRIQLQDSERVRNQLKALGLEGKGTFDSLEKGAGRSASTFRGFASSANVVRGALGGLTAALSVRELVRYTDTWKQLSGRLQIAADSQAKFNYQQSELFNIAQRSRQSLEGVYQLYTRLSGAVGNNVQLQSQLNSVVEAFGKGLAITGESAAAAQGAMIQFTQGIATNFKAGGQELNSLLEQAPRVAQALVDGLNELGLTSNATRGQLKELAKDGVISAENAFAALSNQLPKLNAEFEKIPKTVAQAFTQLDNAFLKYIGQSKVAAAGSNSLAAAIGKVAENVDLLADSVTILSAVLGGRFVYSLSASAAGLVANEVAAVRATRAAAAQAAGLNAATAAAAGNARMAYAMGVAHRAAAGSVAQSTIVVGNTGKAAVVAAANIGTMGTAAATTGRVLLAAFGGPVGLSVTALAGGVAYLATRTSEAEARQSELNAAMGKANDAAIQLEDMNRRLADGTEKYTDRLKAENAERRDNVEITLSQIKALALEEEAKLRLANKSEGELGGIKSLYGLLRLEEVQKDQITRLNRLGDLYQEINRLEASLNGSTGGGAGGGGGTGDNDGKKKQALEDYLKSLREENRLMVLGNKERKIAEAVLRAENAARQDGKKLTSDQRKEIEDLVLAQYKWKEAQDQSKEASEKLKEAQKAAWRPVEQAFENIQDSLVDMLAEGRFTFSSLVQIAKRAAAEMAVAMVIRPAVAGTFASLAGGGGLAGSLTGGGSAGGGFGLGSISGLSNIFSGLSSGFTSPLINPGIAFDIGSQLGLGAGTVGSLHTALGNFTPLSGIASFGGNLLGNAIFGGGGYSGIGGTIGGIAGTAFGGPIGGFVGSLAGNALGGLFGGGKKHPAASFEGALKGNNYSYSALLSKHMDVPEAEAQALGQFLSILTSSGEKIRDARIQGMFGPAGATYRVFGERDFNFDPADASSTAEAMKQLSLYLARTSGIVDGPLIAALSGVQTAGRDAATVLAAVGQRLSFLESLKGFSSALLSDPATSNLSPEEIRKRASSEFLSVAKLAKQGQAGADQVQATALAFLGASQGYAGRASGIYAGDLGLVQTRIDQILKTTPKFAAGGDMQSGLNIVHPGELIYTRGNGHVYNPSETKQLFAGGGEISRGIGEMVNLLNGLIAQVARQTMTLQKELSRSRLEIATMQKQLARVTAA